MAATYLLRIVNDIMEFNKNKPDDIYISFDKMNVTKIYSMIVGPKNTPYFGGYFFFELNFPTNYPASPPTVKFLTTDGKVRFNPNLYECGKVCLSIIGTWPGPGWEPVMTLKSVLISIQSLMGETPLNNEPGYYETPVNNPTVMSYSNYVTYNTYTVAIMDVMNDKFKKYYDMFSENIINHFLMNMDELKNNLLSYAEIHGKMELIKFPYRENIKILDFIKLSKEFTNVAAKII